MGNSRNTVKRAKMCDTKKVALDVKLPDKPVTVSYSKLCDSDDSDSEFDSDDDELFEVEGNGFRLWDWGQLQTLISKICVCKKCGGSMDFVEDSSGRKGWCSKIGLKCSKCFCVEYVTTSPMQGHSADVNTQCVLAMRTICCGRSATRRFSAFMNMPKPITPKCWTEKTDILSDTVREVAQEDMLEACAELTEDCEDTPDVGLALMGRGRLGE